LRIKFRWIWWRFLKAALICLVWNSGLACYYWGALRTPEMRIMWFAMIWCLPHVAIGLLLFYATLAGLLNRTVIQVTPEFLTVRNGPVPWWGNRRLAVDEIERLYCGRHSSSGEEGEGYFSGVKAMTKGGGKVEVVTDLDEPAQARFIKQELERWLQIPGHPDRTMI
jgi:hypothetical protein